MRGPTLTAIVILLWACFSRADMSNDMFFHHHPDLINADLNTHFAKPNNRMAQADNKPSQADSQSSNYVNNEFPQYNPESAQSEQYHAYGRQNDNYGNGYYSSLQSSQGNSYSDYSNARNNYYNTFARESENSNGYNPYYKDFQSNNQAQRENNRYGTNPTSYQPVNKIVYNDDGSINWKKSKSDSKSKSNRNQAKQMGISANQDHSSKEDMIPMGTDPTNFARGIRLAGALPDDGYHRGVGTYYDLETRVSSCGKQNKNSELVAALNSQQMGKQAGSKNPNCGKQIEVTGPSGKNVHVTVVDECKTCPNGGLDLSPAAFEEIGDFSHGSIPIKWKFMDQ
ncbi:RlpA-like double-psi beta-barrel-protein domain-containing protein-containing protein [Blakeslea trispora]|nr:RlpA-like double-psi beta-barrel-protein domain-containing protein-containing protein [Blakeslea trispora]